MRRRLATLGCAVALFGAGACGNAPGGGGSGADKHPKLPGLVSGEGSASKSASAGIAQDSAEMSLYPFRQVEYRLAEGAKAPARSAEAYRIVGDELTDERVAKLSKALGVKANVVSPADGDSVRGNDGQGPSLYVSGTGVPMWSYTADGSGGVVSSGVAVACAPDGSCPEPPAPPALVGLPSEAEAERRALDLLDAAGIDTKGARVEVTGAPSDGRYVQITPSVGKNEILGLTTSVAFGEKGKILHAGGWLGTLESIGEYDLVDLPTALARLQNGGFFGGGREPAILGTDEAKSSESSDAPDASGGSAGGSGTASGSGGQTSGGYPGCSDDAGCTSPGSGPQTAPPDEPVMTIEPQPPVPLEPVEPEIVEISGATVVLTTAYDPCLGHPTYLVPSYLFAPGEVGPVVAVEDNDLAGGGEPTTEDGEPCPGQPMPMGKEDPGVNVGEPEPAPLPERAPEPKPVP